MKVTKKTKEAAKNFLRSYARFSMWDNHDDMTDMESWERTFSFLINDKISVEDFIVTYLPEEIPIVKFEMLEEYGEDWQPLDERFQ